MNAARRLPLARVDLARVGRRPRPEVRLGDGGGALALRLERVRRLQPTVLVGAVMTMVVVATAVFAPLLAPHPYDDQDLSRSLLPPFWLPGANPAYPLGTDFLGRDLLSRLVYGARTSLAVGALAVLLAGAIGVTLGLVAGYFGRLVDSVTMRLVDLQLALPPIVLAIAILTVVQPNLVTIAVVLGLLGWVQYARVMRAQTLSLREREFVLAAQVLGADSPRILRRHVLPNALGPILVIATVNVSAMILAEASLSFLGVGVRPPTPAWGSMLSESRDVFHLAWWTAIFPGLAIVWTVFAINLLGDAWHNRDQ
jgi:peptide/nickel transport system permease protein